MQDYPYRQPTPQQPVARMQGEQELPPKAASKEHSGNDQMSREHVRKDQSLHHLHLAYGRFIRD